MSELEHLVDPVCGMQVSSESNRYYDHAHERYHFCSEHCLNKFSEQPELYLNKRKSESDEPIDETATYTCPMHLEIQQQ